MALSDPLRDPFADLLGYQLRRLSLLVMADLADALQPLGLRPAEATVLLATEVNAGVTQSVLGRMLAIKRANMAPLIAGLEARGLVTRAAVDGRSQALRLTMDGVTVACAARACIQANEDRCFSALAPDERARLAGTLRGAWAVLDRSDQPSS